MVLIIAKLFQVSMASWNVARNTKKMVHSSLNGAASSKSVLTRPVIWRCWRTRTCWLAMLLSVNRCVKKESLEEFDFSEKILIRLEDWFKIILVTVNKGSKVRAHANNNRFLVNQFCEH